MRHMVLAAMLASAISACAGPETSSRESTDEIEREIVTMSKAALVSAVSYHVLIRGMIDELRTLPCSQEPLDASTRLLYTRAEIDNFLSTRERAAREYMDLAHSVIDRNEELLKIIGKLADECRVDAKRLPLTSGKPS